MTEHHSRDHADLAALFAAADHDGGCTVTVAPGKYITGPLRLTKPNMTINAHGASITLAPDTNDSLLTIGPDAMNINILGGRWDGNKASNTAGHVVRFEEYIGPFRVADRSNLELCELLNAPQDALRIERRRVEIKARRCQIRDAGRYGVFFGGTDCAFSDGAIGICAAAGVWNENIGNWITGNGIYTCGTGVVLTHGSRASFTTNNMIDVNKGNGLHIEGTPNARSMDAVVMGNLFLSNSQTEDGTFADVYMSFAHSVALTGNIGSKKVGVSKFPGWAVMFGPGCANITQTGNRWEPYAYRHGTINDTRPFTES